MKNNRMIFRFSLYGFLKDQAYFEPFLILALREKGLSFFHIGLLIGFREVCINLMEVPTGAIADLHGRRRSMVFSMVGYILSFVIFALSANTVHLIFAMFFFAVGEAFRTGTHKAMIFDWLKRENRLSEKTKVYGITRSWSKIGAAVSVVLAGGLVFYSGRYSNVFWFCLPPYLLNLLNLATYPAYLDGKQEGKVSIRDMAGHLWIAGREMLRQTRLRRVLVESMSYEGLYECVRNYIQPLLKLAALSVPLMLSLQEKQRTALLVAAVYFLLHSLESIGSVRSHIFAEKRGGETRATESIWKITLVIFVFLLPALIFHLHWVLIPGFLLLAYFNNVWRPIVLSRYDSTSSDRFGATILSFDSQAKSFAVLVMAPVLGFLVDWAGRIGGRESFWPIGVVGLLIAGAMVIARRRQVNETADTAVVPEKA